MRKLVDTKFVYPFRNNETPIQYGYHLMGKKERAEQNTYSIMYSLGRMASFDAFMEGKFGKFGTIPEHVKGVSYALNAAVSGTESSIVMVGIGGGKGETLLEVTNALTKSQLGALSCLMQQMYQDRDLGSMIKGMRS